MTTATKEPPEYIVRVFGTSNSANLITVCHHKNEARFYAGLCIYYGLTIADGIGFVKSRQVFSVTEVGDSNWLGLERFPIPTVEAQQAVESVGEQLVTAVMDGRSGWDIVHWR